MAYQSAAVCNQPNCWNQTVTLLYWELLAVIALSSLFLYRPIFKAAAVYQSPSLDIPFSSIGSLHQVFTIHQCNKRCTDRKCFADFNHLFFRQCKQSVLQEFFWNRKTAFTLRITFAFETIFFREFYMRWKSFILCCYRNNMYIRTEFVANIIWNYNTGMPSADFMHIVRFEENTVYFTELDIIIRYHYPQRGRGKIFSVAHS